MTVWYRLCSVPPRHAHDTVGLQYGNMLNYVAPTDVAARLSSYWTAVGLVQALVLNFANPFEAGKLIDDEDTNLFQDDPWKRFVVNVCHAGLSPTYVPAPLTSTCLFGDLCVNLDDLIIRMCTSVPHRMRLVL